MKNLEKKAFPQTVAANVFQSYIKFTGNTRIVINQNGIDVFYGNVIPLNTYAILVKNNKKMKETINLNLNVC